MSQVAARAHEEEPRADGPRELVVVLARAVGRHVAVAAQTVGVAAPVAHERAAEQLLHLHPQMARPRSQTSESRVRSQS
eukprot:6209162-Pleurochrysis_carterae.AAC.2